MPREKKNSLNEELGFLFLFLFSMRIAFMEAKARRHNMSILVSWLQFRDSLHRWWSTAEGKVRWEGEPWRNIGRDGFVAAARDRELGCGRWNDLDPGRSRGRVLHRYFDRVPIFFGPKNEERYESNSNFWFWFDWKFRKKKMKKWTGVIFLCEFKHNST